MVTEAAGQGTDTVNASVSYTLAAGSEVEILKVTGVAGPGLTLTGNEFDNTVIGAAGNDTLFGGAGNDRLNGGAGADTMAGGTGNDTYIVDNAGDVVTEVAGEGTDTVNTNLGSYTLGANVENLNFTGAGNFAGTGNTLANVIVGGAGNDTLDDGGIGGADTLNGGAGNDTYFVRNAGETILDSGAGVNTVNTTLLSYTLASNLQNLTFIGSGAFTGTGNQFANVITGGAGNDRFVATVGDGNDTYDGGLGTDTYDLSGTTAGATVNLGLGTSTSADTGTDTLTSIENVIGGSGNDTFVASVGDGNNSYNGGAGTDTYDLSATTADATVNLALGTASSLDIGTDTLTLNTIENVTGGAGNDTLVGNTQNNVLTGGAGNDTLNGGAGTDTCSAARATTPTSSTMPATW